MNMTAIQKYQENNVSLFVNDEASGAIKTYISELSTNTRNNYKGRFNKFISVITGSTIDTVTWNQIMNIKYTDVIAYRKYLIDEGNKNKSVNQTMSSIAKMFRALAMDYKQHKIDYSIFVVRKLSESIHDTNSYGILSEDEMYALLDYCDTVKYKPQSQKLFFEVLFTTGQRFKAIYLLNNKQISQVIDPATKQKVYLIKNIDKSQDRTIAITDDLATRLLNEPKNHDSKFSTPVEGSIFDLGVQSLTNTLKNFCKLNNIEESRNVKLHSIRKASANNALTITNGNITEVAKFLGHKDPKTTLKYYTDMHTNYTEQLSMRSAKDENDIVKLESLSKEELLKLIEKAGIGTVKKLVNMMDR